MTTRTRDELHDEMRRRFGPDPLDWSFTCPSCGDAATTRDFRTALTEYPRRDRSGDPVAAEHVIGQECIGRTLGALSAGTTGWAEAREAGKVRGCDWVAWGLFQGPDFIAVDDRRIPCFAITELSTTEPGDGSDSETTTETAEVRA